jgi:hypothetical protein
MLSQSVVNQLTIEDEWTMLTAMIAEGMMVEEVRNVFSKGGKLGAFYT